MVSKSLSNDFSKTFTNDYLKNVAVSQIGNVGRHAWSCHVVLCCCRFFQADIGGNFLGSNSLPVVVKFLKIYNVSVINIYRIKYLQRFISNIAFFFFSPKKNRLKV